MPATGRAAVMTAAGTDLSLREYPLPRVEPGTILVRITCCTICGSDTLDVSGMADEQIVRAVLDLTDGLGADAAMEVAGIPSLVPLGLRCLRIGGRYVEQGNTYPGAMATIDVSEIVFRWLTIRGVHNYDARHLTRGIDFLAATREGFPFDRLVTHRFPLERVNDALRLARSGEAIRVAVVP